MNMLEVGDRVRVVLEKQIWEATLKEKVGIFWRLDVTHPKDCCNYWTEEKITLVRKR